MRKKPERPTLRTDFLLRKKGWAQDSYIALEIKQNNDATSCVKKYDRRLRKKAPKIKRSELELRSFWTTGITPVIDRERLDSLIDCYLDEKFLSY